MKRIPVEIRPGGMISDVVENELGITQHKSVTNLRQLKEGEWETVKGYVNHLTGGTAFKNFIEVTFDQTDERFLLIQEGTTLIRIDYDSGYDYADAETLTLPTGISILSTQKLRFFEFRGVVRITGAVLTADTTTQVPLWYGYIDRTIERYGITDFEHTGWFLEKSTCDINVNPTNVTPINTFSVEDSSGSALVASEFKIFYIKAFYISDGGQFSLLKDISSMVNFTIKTTNYTTLGYGLNFELSIPYSASDCFSNFPRLTGIGIAMGYKNSNETTDKEIDNWEIVDIIDMEDQDWRDISWVDCFYDESYTPNYDAAYDVTKVVYTHGLTDNDENRAKLMFLQSHFKSGWPVKITGPNGTVTTSVDAHECQFVDLGTSVILEIYLNDDVTTAFDSTTDQHVQVDFSLPKVRFYGSDFRYLVVLDLINYTGISLRQYRDYAIGTTDIDPQYSHHQILAERGFCLSLEDEEEDIVRYSPIYQYDTFPNGNIIQTQVGDGDRLKAIAVCSEWVYLIKSKSISKIHFVGNSYYEDIAFKDNGIYSDDGYFVYGNDVYWMDKDDIYVATVGSEPIELMKVLGLRKLYRQYVDDDSFLFYDPGEKELWLVLNGVILVYQFERKAWYYRSTDVTPLAAIRDYDKNLIVMAGTKLVNYSHSESDFDEEIGFKFISRLIDVNTEEKTKRMGDFIIPVQSSGDIKITANDPNKTQSFNTTKTPSTTEVEAIRTRLKYSFKQLELTVENSADADDLSVKFRKMKLMIGIW